MGKKILVDHGCVKLISEALNCSTTHVRFCLRGVIRSELSEKVRAKALELGGVEVH